MFSINLPMDGATHNKLCYCCIRLSCKRDMVEPDCCQRFFFIIIIKVPFQRNTSSYSYFEFFRQFNKRQNMIKKNYQQCFAFLHIKQKFKFAVHWNWFLETKLIWATFEKSINISSEKYLPRGRQEGKKRTLFWGYFKLISHVTSLLHCKDSSILY